MALEFKQGPGAVHSTALGARGVWQVHPWEDNRRGDRWTLLLFRDPEKPRPFGHFITPDDAQAAADKYDERGN